MKKIAIFASGSGSNAENIAEYFRQNQNFKISAIISNKKDAYVLERAKKLNISSFVFSKSDFADGNAILDFLKNNNIDFIVLAGFLLKIPENMITAFPRRIINIHPALLPKYGGKGMYGHYVHQAVCVAKEKESGITIHYVNENYDEGDVIFQAKCQLTPDDTPDSIAQKVHRLEYEWFPQVIEKVINGKI